jgi:hypothetical protein
MRALSLLLVLSSLAEAVSVGQRRKVVQSFNVRRTKSSDSTPLQVGNGNFAFGADVTGLQTFKPYAIMSTWGWHNFSLPTTPGQTSVDGTPFPWPVSHPPTDMFSRLHRATNVDPWQVAEHLTPVILDHTLLTSPDL